MSAFPLIHFSSHVLLWLFFALSFHANLNKNDDLYLHTISFVLVNGVSITLKLIEYITVYKNLKITETTNRLWINLTHGVRLFFIKRELWNPAGFFNALRQFYVK